MVLFPMLHVVRFSTENTQTHTHTLNVCCARIGGSTAQRANVAPRSDGCYGSMCSMCFRTRCGVIESKRKRCQRMPAHIRSTIKRGAECVLSIVCRCVYVCMMETCFTCCTTLVAVHILVALCQAQSVWRLRLECGE